VFCCGARRADARQNPRTYQRRRDTATWRPISMGPTAAWGRGSCGDGGVLRRCPKLSVRISRNGPGEVGLRGTRRERRRQKRELAIAVRESLVYAADHERQHLQSGRRGKAEVFSADACRFFVGFGFCQLSVDKSGRHGDFRGHGVRTNKQLWAARRRGGGPTIVERLLQRTDGPHFVVSARGGGGWNRARGVRRARERHKGDGCSTASRLPGRAKRSPLRLSGGRDGETAIGRGTEQRSSTADYFSRTTEPKPAGARAERAFRDAASSRHNKVWAQNPGRAYRQRRGPSRGKGWFRFLAASTRGTPGAKCAHPRRLPLVLASRVDVDLWMKTRGTGPYVGHTGPPRARTTRSDDAHAVVPSVAGHRTEDRIRFAIAIAGVENEVRRRPSPQRGPGRCFHRIVRRGPRTRCGRGKSRKRRRRANGRAPLLVNLSVAAAPGPLGRLSTRPAIRKRQTPRGSPWRPRSPPATLTAEAPQGAFAPIRARPDNAAHTECGGVHRPCVRHRENLVRVRGRTVAAPTREGA